MFAVVSVTAIPDHLRGYVGRLLQQAGPGLYVGKLSPKVADALWDKLTDHADIGAAVMIRSSHNDAGFEIQLHQVVGLSLAEYDGIVLPNEIPRT